MQMRLMHLTLLVGAISESGCMTSAQSPFVEISLGEGTKQIQGWLSTRGEWTLFPTPNIRGYDPYTASEDRKCVSLINGTMRPRTVFNAFHGKKVYATGYVIKFESLRDGNTTYDKLLSKKYYENDVVENYCNRDFVFVVKSINWKLR